MSQRKIKIRLINPLKGATTGTEKEEETRLASLAGPHTEMSFSVAKGPPSIESRYEDALATPPTAQACIEAEKEGVDGIIINCTADTGLEVCREVVSIPVVGLSQPAMYLAAQLTHRFSVLTFLDRVNSRFEDWAVQWGMTHKLASVRSVGIPVAELDANRERLAKKLFEIGKRCVLEDGAHGLVLGCGSFEIASPRVRELFAGAKLPVILIEPYPVALHQLEDMILIGISHSKLSYLTPKCI